MIMILTMILVLIMASISILIIQKVPEYPLPAFCQGVGSMGPCFVDGG